MALEIAHPQVQDKKFGSILFHENTVAFGGGYTNDELQIIEVIVLTASEKLDNECLDNNKKGFILGVAFSSNPPIIVQIGEIDQEDVKYGADGKKLRYMDFARAKIIVLQSNTHFTRSSENAKLSNKYVTYVHSEDVPGGAVAFDNGYIISISGLSSDPLVDEQASLKIGQSLGFVEATSSNF